MRTVTIWGCVLRLLREVPVPGWFGPGEPVGTRSPGARHLLGVQSQLL